MYVLGKVEEGSLVGGEIGVTCSRWLECGMSSGHLWKNRETVQGVEVKLGGGGTVVQTIADE